MTDVSTPVQWGPFPCKAVYQQMLVTVLLVDANWAHIVFNGREKHVPVVTLTPPGKDVSLKQGHKGVGSMIPSDIRKRYSYNDKKTPAGNRCIDNADDVATKLRGWTLAQVYDHTAKELGVPVNDLLLKYEKLNPGQQRMNLGNRLRALYRKRESEAASVAAAKDAPQPAAPKAPKAAKTPAAPTPAPAPAPKKAEKAAPAPAPKDAEPLRRHPTPKGAKPAAPAPAAKAEAAAPAAKAKGKKK